MGERKLFGTDGVRGPVGTLLTPELAMAIGRAAVAEAPAERPQVVIVRDTRESGPMLEAAFAAGVAAAGGSALIAGVLPSAAASVLTRRLGLDFGAVISASHNPWTDNGIKLFGPAGAKLDDDAEARIEQRIAAGAGASAGGPVGAVGELAGTDRDYLRSLGEAFTLELSGRKVVLDCANGAAYRVAPAVFEALGAEVEAIAAAPDGRNINEGCGSTSIELLTERMRAGDADAGFAFDGDADRVLAVDGDGRVLDGDEIVAACALHLRREGRLAGGVAVTVMSNLGFHRAMADAGIEVATTPVGDRHVIAELLRRDWALGGEQSGHVIWAEIAPCGDGIASALLLMQALGHGDLAELRPFEKLPQRQGSVPLPDGVSLDGAPGLWELVEREEASLKGRGRVLVRPSGTEPLVRLMVEAPSAEECERVLERLTGGAREALSM